jgi:hypothetical protein
MNKKEKPCSECNNLRHIHNTDGFVLLECKLNKCRPNRHHCFGELPIGELGVRVDGRWRKAKQK